MSDTYQNTYYESLRIYLLRGGENMKSKARKIYLSYLKRGLGPTLIMVIVLILACSHCYANKSIKLMRLDRNTKPVFRLAPILEYQTGLVNDLIEGNHLLNQSTLHLSITIPNKTLEMKQLIQDINLLSQTSVFLSLVPAQDTTDEVYISAYLDVLDTLRNQDTQKLSSNLQVVCYPVGEKLEQYAELQPDNIGITLSTSEDLQLLDKLYSFFGETSMLFVNDTIPSYYKADIKMGARTVYDIYYNLAIKYPKITTIYNPYMTLIRHKWMREIDETRLPDLDMYYISAYERLISKPWITTKEIDIIATSPYSKVNEYDTLCGIEELIVSPDDGLLEKYKKTSKVPSYITYRTNTSNDQISPYYPYEVIIDTNTLPNSINRIKALIYSSDNTLIDVPSVDVIVENDNVKDRASQTQATYASNKKSVYRSGYIPILMYHTIADEVDDENQNSCVETTVFDSQMKALVDYGYTPINFKQLNDYLEGSAGLPKKPVLITMDDGYLNNYTIAYPIYKKYNMAATLFVSPFYMQEQNTDRHFGFAAAREMEASGLIDIQSHGYDHTPLTKLSIRDLKYQVSFSRGILEQQLGARSISVLAYPQFRNNKLTRQILTEQGVDLQITSVARVGTKLEKTDLKRINVPNTMTPDALIATLEAVTQ